MSRRLPRAMTRLLIVGALLAATLPVAAQSLLIRGATVHTAGPQGSLQNTDVLVRNGRVAAVGAGLAAGDAQVVEANGRPLTPTLFGGVTGSGIEEVSGERGTRDDRLSLGEASDMAAIRPASRRRSMAARCWTGWPRRAASRDRSASCTGTPLSTSKATCLPCRWPT